MAPCGNVFADTGSDSSDVKTTTTFKVPNNFTSSYSVNSINESKAYAPSGGGVSFGGIGFGGIGFGGGTSTAIGAGAVGTGAAIHYMRGKRREVKKLDLNADILIRAQNILKIEVVKITINTLVIVQDRLIRKRDKMGDTAND